LRARRWAFSSATPLQRVRFHSMRLRSRLAVFTATFAGWSGTCSLNSDVRKKVHDLSARKPNHDNGSGQSREQLMIWANTRSRQSGLMQGEEI
jgi:hypothetical protein